MSKGKPQDAKPEEGMEHDEAEFETIFNEGEESAKDQSGDEASDDTDSQSGKDSSGQSSEEGDSGAADKPAEDDKGEDSVEGKDSEGGASEGEDEGVKEEKKPDDPWSGLKPDQLEQVTRLQHFYQSQRGRQAGYEKKIADLEEKIGASDEAPPDETVLKALQSEENWSEFAEEFPAIAKAVSGFVGGALKNVQDQIGKVRTDVSNSIQPLQEGAADNKATAEYDVLARPVDQGGFGHSDWNLASASPEFSHWVAKQPDSVFVMARDGDARDMAFVLSSFKSATGWKPPAAPNGPGGDHVNQTVAEREQRLKEGESPVNRGSDMTRTASGDGWDTEFNEAVRSDERAGAHR